MTIETYGIVVFLRENPGLQVLHFDAEQGFTKIGKPAVEKVMEAISIHDDGSFYELGYLSRFTKDDTDELLSVVNEFSTRDLGKEWEEMQVENMQVVDTLDPKDEYTINMWKNMSGEKQEYIRDSWNYHNLKVEILRRLNTVEPSIVFYGT